jgi:hypothetical protein
MGDYDRFRREFGAAAGQEYDPYRYRSEATKYAEGLEGYGAVTNRGILFDPGTDLSGAPTPSMPRAIDDMDQYRATATGREGVTSSPVSAYDRTGTRGTRDIDRGGITSYYEPQAMPEYQNAPPLNMQGSPLYQWQREQGEEAINRQLSARGLLTSGAGMGTLADYYRAMDANEAMRIQNLMRTMAGFSAPTPSFSGNYNPASLAMQAGGQMGSTYQTGGVNQANALLQAGQARSGMWTNLANVGMAGMNAYSQYQGLNNFYGGGGTNLNQLAPAISY